MQSGTSTDWRRSKEDERDAIEAVRAGNPLPPPRITLSSAHNILLARYNDIVRNGETEQLDDDEDVTASVRRAMAVLHERGFTMHPPQAPAVQQHYPRQVPPPVHPRIQQRSNRRNTNNGRGCYHCDDPSHCVRDCPILQGLKPAAAPAAAPAAGHASLGHLIGQLTQTLQGLQAVLPAGAPAPAPRTLYAASGAPAPDAGAGPAAGQRDDAGPPAHGMYAAPQQYYIEVPPEQSYMASGGLPTPGGPAFELPPDNRPRVVTGTAAAYPQGYDVDSDDYESLVQDEPGGEADRKSGYF